MLLLKYFLLTSYFCVTQCWVDILKAAILLTHIETDKHGLSWITVKVSASIESAISTPTVLFLLEQDHSHI